MGTFLGHAIPGTFFIVFGIWYAVRIFHMYYKSRQRNARFTSQLTMDCPCLCGRLKTLPMEAFVKIVFLSMGIVAENINFHMDTTPTHTTMFAAFGLTGVADVLVHYKAPLPKDLSYASNVLAFVIEGLLFKFHLFGRSDLDVLLHTLLVYVIFLTVISFIAEIQYRHYSLIPLCRSYLILLQGTWFWQVGYILYSPISTAEPWKPGDHIHLMLASLYFTWHCAACFVFILLVGLAVALCSRRFNLGASTEQEMRRMIQSEDGGYQKAASSDNDASESEISDTLNV